MNLEMKESRMILVINCGSSSVKYEVFQMPDCRSLGKGLVERIGEKMAKVTQQTCCKKIEKEFSIPDHKMAMEIIKEVMTDNQDGIIGDIREIKGVGHRVVHGGEKYAYSVLIDDDVIKVIEDNIELAPLHNPPNLIGIREAANLLPEVKQVAVFDTAFHQTLPPCAYLYALPREMYDKFRIRRYGFHGTSHRYVAAKAVKYLKRSTDNTNLITCHLGNGSSITAIENGKSIDTSMGFTPLQGLVMGTRSGDIDPAIIFYLMERGYTSEELNKMLNKKSGLLGLSGISNDLRDLEQAAEQSNRQAIETLEVYAYSIRKYIGAYSANLVKVDALVFTGGIGQFGIKMRERICHKLENIGIFMDYRKNLENGSQEGIISMPYSPTVIIVEPTNEELQIAIDTDQIIFNPIIA